MERTYKVLEATVHPNFFLRDPYFLGVEPFPKQEEIFVTFYDDKFKELVLISGNKSGKTELASFFACYEAFKLLILPNPQEHYHLMRDKIIFILVVAASEKQAFDTIWRAVVSKVMRCPFFKEFRPHIYTDEIRFESKGISILLGTSSSATLTGRDVKIVLLDELDRFEESVSKRGAWNVYNTVKRMTTMFKEFGYCVSISSVRHNSSIMMTLFRQSKTSKVMMGRKYATWEFNPNITFESLRPELERDPASFWTDYGSEPMQGVMSYIPNIEIVPFDDSIPNVLEGLIVEDVVLPHATSSTYVLAGDPALRHDAFGLALLRADENDIVRVEGVHRYSPQIGELNPIDIKNDIVKVINTFPIFSVVFDTWQFPELQEEIRRKGVQIEDHIVRKVDYDRFKERCYRKTIRLCNYPWLRQELEQLKIINAQKVDHLPGGSKDVADSVVNGLWALTELLPKRTFPLNIVRTF